MVPTRILLADSDVNVREAVNRVAKSHGHEIIHAATAAEVFAAAFAFVPDLIVLEGEFSDGDGRDVLARLKKDKRTAHLPVLMWSTHRDTDSERRIALTLGAEDYVEKSDPHTLITKIERLLLRLR